MPAIIKQRNATEVVLIENGITKVYKVEPSGRVYTVNPNTGYTDIYPICQRLQTHGTELRATADTLLEIIRSERKRERDHLRRLTQKNLKEIKAISNFRAMLGQ